MSNELKVIVNYPLQNSEKTFATMEETVKMRDKGKQLKDAITKTINDTLGINFKNSNYDVFVLDNEGNWKDAIGNDTSLEYLAINYGIPLKVIVVVNTENLLGVSDKALQGGRRKRRRKTRRRSHKKRKRRRRRKTKRHRRKRKSRRK